jgi:hypothetical protein
LMFLSERVLLIISEYHRYFKKRPGLECGKMLHKL